MQQTAPHTPSFPFEEQDEVLVLWDPSPGGDSVALPHQAAPWCTRGYTQL